jgi:orotate phosphoribosyltransferase
MMTNTPSMLTRLAELLLEKSYMEGSFVLTSGKKSDYYFDCKQTALDPEGGWLIGNIFLDMIARHGNIRGVGGMTLGADPLVSAVSVLSHIRKMPLPGFIVRKTSKGHGTNQYLEDLKPWPRPAMSSSPYSLGPLCSERAVLVEKLVVCSVFSDRNP